MNTVGCWTIMLSLLSANQTDALEEKKIKTSTERSLGQDVKKINI